MRKLRGLPGLWQNSPHEADEPCFDTSSMFWRRQLAGQKGTLWEALCGQGASRSGGIVMTDTPQTESQTGTIPTANSFYVSGVGGHGGRDGERSAAVTGDGGAACMGTVRWRGPPTAGTGLSPSLGCLACFSLQCNNHIYNGCKCNFMLVFLLRDQPSVNNNSPEPFLASELHLLK